MKKRQTKVCEKCCYYSESKIKAASDCITRIYCYCDISMCGAPLGECIYFVKRADGKPLEFEWERLLVEIYEEKELPKECPCKLEQLIIGEKQ